MPKKITKINLNDFEQVKTREELEGHTSIIITPKKHGDKQLDDIYFRKPITVIEIDDVDNAVWYKDVRISREGTIEEYTKRVEWWYDNAIKDADYRAILNATYNKHGFDIKSAWEKSKYFLYGLTPAGRKTYLAQYVNKWMSKGIARHLQRKEMGWK